jgi:ferredoxin--NADP+ reductase
MSDEPDGVRVAVIGSGPAGFYATERLLAAGALVDLFDRLVTPWGLVRSGVAPDHPKIKSVSRVFEKVAALPGFRFAGNVEVGRDVSHAELAAHYHAVLYATGAARDRRLGVPGEELAGSVPATDFVGWYNGHPDNCDDEYDLSADRAVVLGNGNVALDVARMLALTTDELRCTDVADHALAALATSRVREIVVLGRRGPFQAAFTNPELTELGELADADVVVDPAEAELDELSRAQLADAPAGRKRNVETIARYAARPPAGRTRRIVLRFLASPLEILGEDTVTGVLVGRNRLVAAADSTLRAEPTGEHELIETGLVLRSVGYLGSPIDGVPFDSGRIPNADGRVLDDTGTPIPGLYAAGWIKRGPSGVIGTNKRCASETVTALLADRAAGLLPVPTADTDITDELAARGVRVVGYAGWQAVDEHERRRGQESDRPRVKLVRHPELVAHAYSASAR